VLAALQHKLASTPHGRWRTAPHFIVFSAAGFTPRMVEVARAEGVLLVGPDEFVSGL
jgi:hypothetical protein